MPNSQPNLLERMHQLVAQPSMSSENKAFDVSNARVIHQLAEWLEPLGFACEIVPTLTAPDKLNLIAMRGSGPGGLVLSGHSDTVPYDHGDWASDPFVLSERDGRLHGLGICDMKCFLAMAVQIAEELVNTPLQQPLIILATADEESGMDGIRAIVESGRPKARYALIGEPTGMRPIRTHKGILMDSIRVQGHAGHSSRPDIGANAIEGMQQVLSALITLRGEFEQMRSDGGFALNYPTLNLGCIHGGDSANRIPAHCELQIDLRFPPGMPFRELRDQVHERVRQAMNTPGCSVSFESLFEGVPGFQTPADSELVRICEQLSGHASGAVDFATEGEFLNQMGMQTVVLGPGNIEQAHQPDEFLALDRITPMMSLLRSLVKQHCLG